MSNRGACSGRPGRARAAARGRAAGFVSLHVAVALAVVAWAALGGAWLVRRDLPRWTRLWRGATGADALAAVIEAQPARPIEPRLSRPVADRHRPFDGSAARAGAGIPYATLSGLERLGDEQGLATAHLLAGDLRRAAQHLALLDPAVPDPRGPIAAAPPPGGTAVAALDSDRAALALLRGDAEEALRQVEAALADRPGMTQALWNRALAERALGLEMAAAVSFEEVARAGEPGWSAEAAAKAKALRAAVEERNASWTAARAAGEAMRRGGPVAPLPLVRRHPGVLRLFFYDALRAARDRARAQALLPVARALDEASGGEVLARLVERVSRADFAVRAPLAAEYVPMFDDKQAPGLSERAGAAGQADIALGAMFLGDQIEAHLDEYRRLAAATDDPWFAAITAHFTARVDAARGDLLVEEQHLREGLAACNAASIEYRCAKLTHQLSALYRSFNRPIEARQVVTDAWWRARRIGEWGFEINFLNVLAVTARQVGNYPLARAYLREVQLQDGDNCGIAYFVAENQVELAFREGRIEDARRSVRAVPPCGEPLTSEMAASFAALADFGLSSDEVRSALAALASARVRPLVAPAEKVAFDVAEARLLARNDPARASALLELAITRAEALPRWDADAQRTRWDAYAALVDEAGQSGRLREAMVLLEREQAVPHAGRCVVGLSLDLDRLLVVGLGADGKVVGRYEPHLHGPVVPAEVVGPEVVEALVGCPAVDVLARPPFQGRPDLLPRALAWRYRIAHPRAQPGAKVTPRRLVVSGVEPPASLGLPPLRPWSSPPLGREETVTLEGPAAHPGRVLAELAGATEVEFHTHGLVDSAISDASLLVLSPGSDGQYALSARQIRDQRLEGAPLVVLAACRAAAFAPYVHEAWSLPAAFLAAGARGVLASPSPLSDAEAGPFFAGVRARIHAGAPAAVALRDERVAWLARNPKASVGDVLLFE